MDYAYCWVKLLTGMFIFSSTQLGSCGIASLLLLGARNRRSSLTSSPSLMWLVLMRQRRNWKKLWYGWFCSSDKYQCSFVFFILIFHWYGTERGKLLFTWSYLMPRNSFGIRTGICALVLGLLEGFFWCVSHWDAFSSLASIVGRGLMCLLLEISGWPSRNG